MKKAARKHKDGKEVVRWTPSTINRMLALLRKVLNDCASWGYLKAAPKVKLLPVAEQDFDYLQRDEIERLLGWTAERAETEFALYAAAIYTGARMGELYGLQWSDVDLDGGRITLRRSYDREYTKSKRIRRVPINRQLSIILREWRRRCPSDVLVFSRGDGTMRIRERPPVGFTAHLAGARCHPITFHDLRHTAASHMVMSGMHLRTVQSILGHSTIQVTERYAHLAADFMSTDVDRLSLDIGRWGRLQSLAGDAAQLSLNLNVHFHTLMIDGVYEIRSGGAALFHPVPAPTDEDVAALTEQVYRKIARVLDARADDDGTALASAEPVLASLAGASAAGVVANGPRRGARTLRLGSGTASGATIAGRRCAAVEGFSLHANVRVAANDRDGLEHLARYLARPPVATDRLTQLPDGRVALRFKRRLSDGTEAVVFTPFELIERLLPLIPRPRKHTIRFHGILAPAAGYRSKVVPAPENPAPPKKPPPPERPTPYRLPWANLLRRVFLVDALECPRCHGRMRIVAAVTEPGAVERILQHLGESPAPPLIAGPRAPPDPHAEEAESRLPDLPDPDCDPGA